MTEPTVGRDLDKALAETLGLTKVGRTNPDPNGPLKKGYALFTKGSRPAIIAECPSTNWREAAALLHHVWQQPDSPLKKAVDLGGNKYDVALRSKYFRILMGNAEAICRLILEVCQKAKNG